MVRQTSVDLCWVGVPIRRSGRGEGSTAGVVVCAGVRAACVRECRGCGLSVAVGGWVHMLYCAEGRRRHNKGGSDGGGGRGGVDDERGG